MTIAIRGLVCGSVFLTLVSCGPEKPKTDSEFRDMASAGNVAAMEQALTKKPDINSRDSAGRTALFYAVMARKTDAVKFLLEHGADTNICETSGQVSPLEFAMTNGDPNMVPMLLDAGADPNHSDARGWVPLIGASTPGNATMVQLLLKKGAAASYRASTGLDLAGSGPLHRTENPEVIRLLVKAGADINAAEDVLGRTPLHNAALAGAVPAVKELLRLGADPDVADGGGYTPLNVTLEAGRSDPKIREVVQALVSAGAEPNKRNAKGETAFDVAERKGLAWAIELMHAKRPVKTGTK